MPSPHCVFHRAIDGTYLAWENEQLRQIMAYDQPPPPRQGHSASYDAQGQPLWRGRAASVTRVGGVDTLYRCGGVGSGYICIMPAVIDDSM